MSQFVAKSALQAAFSSPESRSQENCYDECAARDAIAQVDTTNGWDVTRVVINRALGG